MPARTARADPSSRSTAPRFPRRCSNPNCSDTRRALSRARSRAASASSRRRMAARCCSTRSRRWTCGCRPSSCAPCRSASSTGSAAPARSRSPSAPSRRRTPTSPRAPADTRDITQEFLRLYAGANGAALRPLAADAKRQLSLARWPGNVRELENTIHRAVLMASGDEIGVDAILSPDGLRLDQAKPPAVAHAALAAEAVTRSLVGRTVADVERDLILETLKHCLGNRTHAANILGISIRTLRNKLNEYSGDCIRIPPPGGGEMLMAG